MAESSIDLIRKAETEAETAARRAAEEARQILDDAHNRAIRLGQKAEDDARERAAGQVAAAHMAGKQALEAGAADLSAEMDALAEKARARQDKAIKMILGALA